MMKVGLSTIAVDSLDKDTEASPSEMLNSAMVEQFAECEITFRLVGRVNNRFPSVEDFRVVNRLVIECGKNSDGLGMSASSHEPSGGLR
jgi:hypothetical protein